MEQGKRVLQICREHKNACKAAAMIAIVIIAVLVFGAYGEKDEFSVQFTEDETIRSQTEEQAGQPLEGEKETAAEIYVDISGAVKNPGVYVVSEGTRLFEVIEKAGGVTKDAWTEQVNQAEVVSDGQKVMIPAKGEEGTSSQGEAPFLSGKASDGRININTADRDTLQEIPGVGPATADKIIAYRNEHGRFTQIEDLKNVSGIGEKTFEKMKEKIFV